MSAHRGKLDVDHQSGYSDVLEWCVTQIIKQPYIPHVTNGAMMYMDNNMPTEPTDLRIKLEVEKIPVPI
jgi:hypothetical protein